jgi:uncharacterized protein YhaN
MNLKIIDLQIYGYGKIENKEIGNLSPAIQLFFGKNEAGKSTLMSFIHSILFGFPTKLQQDLRYEPKSGAKYGGKITLQTSEFGTITVERLPGKASGDVTVFLSDGTTGGEEILKELFQGMDKSFYQRVYSYNLQGLQGVQQMNAEQLGNYLFSAGAVGTDALVKVNDRISKELESLFKPTGRKPLLNQQLNDLRDSHQLLNQAQEKNNAYQSLLEEKETLQQELVDTGTEINVISNEYRQLEQMISMHDVIIERETVLKEIDSLPSSAPFPVDGVVRLEQLHSQLLPYKAQLTSLVQKREKLIDNLNGIKLNEKILDHESTIREVTDHLKSYQDLQLDFNELKRDIQHIKNEISVKAEQLGWTGTEEEILRLDTSISKKEEVKTELAEFEQIKQQKHFLDEQFQRSKLVLEATEEKIKDLKQQLLPHETKVSYEEIVNSTLTAREYEIEKKKANELITKIESKINKYRDQEKVKSKHSTAFYTVFLSIVAILLVWLSINNQWLFAGALLLISIFSLFIMKKSIAHGDSIVIHDLIDEKRELEEKLSQLNEQMYACDKEERDLEQIQEFLIKDRELKRLLDIEKINLAQNERNYEKVVSEYESWEDRRCNNHHRINEILKQYRLSETLFAGKLLDIYYLIEELKGTIRKKNQYVEKMEEIELKITSFERKVMLTSEVINITTSDTVQAVNSLFKLLEGEKLKAEDLKRLNEKLGDINEQINQLKVEIDFIENESLQLFILAEVSNEEDFRGKGKVVKQRSELNNRLSILEGQIGTFLKHIDDYQAENGRERLEFLEERLNLLKTKEKEKRDRLSEVKIRIRELEEGGTYADLFHSFEQNKSMFQEQVKKWAIQSVAKDILTKTIERYRGLRLPRLLSDAEDYFRILTDHAYVRIYSPDNQSSFVVERKDGVRFYPNELSQATAEQLYIALRIALGKTMHPMVSYPFIVDDSFVNFDEKRTERVVTLLKNLSSNHQILLFTCHKHIIEQFDTEDIVYL